MSNQAPTRILTALAVAGVLGLGLQADSAGGAPAEQTKAASTAAKDKAAKKDKAATKDKAAAKDKAATKAKAAATKAKTPAAKTPAAAATTAPPPPSAEAVAVKEAIGAARKGKTSQAEDLQKSIGDPVARKLIEWAILRSDETASVSFNRYMAFVAENPSWPAVAMLRRRAEATLWSDRRDPAFVLAYFGKERPLTTKGKFALARALLLQGDRAGAQRLVREAWQNDDFSAELEGLALDVFKELLTAADYKARMDMRLYAEDTEDALRAANRAGGNAPAIAKARIAVIKKAANANALLDALPAETQRDVGLTFSRVQLLRRADSATEAAELILSIRGDHGQATNSDEWWVERRLVARKLLDLGEVKTAYRVVRDAAIPSRDNYRAEHQFTAGWIALRFLNDPTTALGHFAKIGQGNNNPITLARAGYWQGRAAEALGRNGEARTHYEAAAHYSTAYYGQIARARLGHKDIVVRPPPEPTPDRREAVTRLELVRVVELLYAIDERDLIAGALADLGDRLPDAGTLAAVGEVAARHKDARAMLLLGKSALARGLALDHYAFPIVGVPEYRAIGPEIEFLRGLCHRAPGEHLQPQGHLQRTRHGPDAGHARRRPLCGQEIRRLVRRETIAERPDLQRATGRGRARRPLRRLSRLPYSHLRGLQCRAWASERLDRAIRRPPRSEGRSDRLGGADSVLRDAQLCAARPGEPAGIPRALRRRLEAVDRGGPAPRGCAQLEHDPEKWVPVFGKDHAPALASRELVGAPSYPFLPYPFLRIQNWYMPTKASGLSDSNACQRERSAAASSC